MISSMANVTLDPADFLVGGYLSKHSWHRSSLLSLFDEDSMILTIHLMMNFAVAIQEAFS